MVPMLIALFCVLAIRRQYFPTEQEAEDDLEAQKEREKEWNEGWPW